MNRSAGSRPAVVITDFLSGRGLGGHYDDYLAALTEALSDYNPHVVAPFVAGERPPEGRFGIYEIEFDGYRRAFRKRAGEERVAIIHSAQFSDYICIWAASRLIGRVPRSKVLLVLRRSPTPESMAVGNKWLGKLLIWMITELIKRRKVHLVSDSAVALGAWLERVPGAQGQLIALPPVPGAAAEEPPTIALPKPDGPLVVIAGRMRAEKGSAAYPDVVDATLEALPDGAIALQTCEDDQVSRDALQKIRAEHDGDPRVALLGDHLTGADYHALLTAADIVVLPYDTAVYGTGTSGVVSDALALGAVVVVSPIEWVTSTYANDPRVVLLEGSVQDAIAEAATRISHGAVATDPQAEFAASWIAAIDAVTRRSE